jgi:hypothetical protein
MVSFCIKNPRSSCQGFSVIQFLSIPTARIGEKTCNLTEHCFLHSKDLKYTNPEAYASALPAFFHSVNVVEVPVCGFLEKYFSSALDKRCLSAPDNILVPPATAVCTVCITLSLLFSMVQNKRDSFETISVASCVRSSAQICSLS